MYKYLISHEEYIHGLLQDSSKDCDWGYIKQYHEKQIKFMQHERLVHLLVTLFFGLFLMISIGITWLNPHIAFLLLDLLLMILLVPYIIHYFRLENGVQRWYELSNQIDEKLNK